MAKRYTNTEKWKTAWYRQLPLRMKAFLEYLNGLCDHAGLWEPDYELASFTLGETFTATDMDLLGDQITPTSSGKIFIPSFIEEQYDGKLFLSNRVHRSVLKLLEKHGVDASKFRQDGEDLPPSPAPSMALPISIHDPSLGLNRVYVDAKDKDKEKDTDRKGGVGEKQNVRSRVHIVTTQPLDRCGFCGNTGVVVAVHRDSKTEGNYQCSCHRGNGLTLGYPPWKPDLLTHHEPVSATGGPL